MAKGRDLVNEAVNDAKALKEAALSAAKNELLEAMAPRIKELLEKNIKGVLAQNEDADRIRRGIQDNWPGESHSGFEEGKTHEKGESKMDKDNKPQDEKELDLESLASFFPSMSEMPEEDPAQPKVDENPASMMIPTLGEAEACEDEDGEMKEAKKDKEEEKMDEEIEISESELKKVYEAALAAERLAEVQVKKGFGDMTKAGELDDVVKDAGKGLNPEKKGETPWEKGEVEDKKDWMVKEAIAKGMAENKALRENLRKAVGMIRALGAKLHETNLFNAKVLHVNRMLNKHKLTSEQRKVVLESIDKAKSVDEVKTVFEAIDSSFAVSQSLSESVARKPVANAQRPRTSGTPDQKVLSESVDRQEKGQYSRLAQLAGLDNLK